MQFVYLRCWMRRNALCLPTLLIHPALNEHMFATQDWNGKTNL